MHRKSAISLTINLIPLMVHFVQVNSRHLVEKYLVMINGVFGDEWLVFWMDVDVT